MKLGEEKVWSVRLVGAEFQEIKALVHALLERIYDVQVPERVVAATVFTPLTEYAQHQLLKVWVIPRHGHKVIIKITYTECLDDWDMDREHARAFEKIKLDLLDMLKLGFKENMVMS